MSQGVTEGYVVVGSHWRVPALGAVGACVGLSVVVWTIAGLVAAPAALADACTPPIINPVVCENTQPGSPSSAWAIPTNDAGDPTIQGFATAISLNKGNTVGFKINTAANAYTIDIYRMGYYGGLGARKIVSIVPSVALPQTQPACLTNATTGLIDCGDWAVSASWNVPTTAVSGIYFAKLTRTDTGGSSHIVFVVRDDTANSPVLFQTSDTTWQAYNTFGGNSLYTGSPAGRAFKVSYNRPFNTASVHPESWVLAAEYPMVRWLEANGYNLSYASGVDIDALGAAALETHRVFLSVGHDEYWSGNQRANLEAARDAGLNLAFFSGNEVFWKTRWENSTDGTNTPYRTLVSYKETHADAVIDPADPPTWTGTWRDLRFSPPADGARPENALVGNLSTVNGVDNRAMTVSSDFSRMRFWRNTSVATLLPGQVATFTAGCYCLIGYEWNEDVDNGFRPSGLIQLSSTTNNVNGHFLDFGNSFGPGTATHALTLYRAASGALIFSAGTVDWSFALDTNHTGRASAVEPAIQQATVNVLADMGIQPSSLTPGLLPAVRSTNSVPPTSRITSVASGALLPSGPATISGVATAAPGDVIANVEVSVDSGATWHRAAGRENWTYSWDAGILGPATLLSRATDDSVIVETPAPGIPVTFTQRACPCTFWDQIPVPSNLDVNDSHAAELGLKFTSSASGFATGIRFYKGPQNIGPHLGDLWSSTGALLASATFTNETASGWQQVNFSTPVAISANTTYIAAYHTSSGFSSADTFYFLLKGVDNAPLHAPLSGTAGGNGVYAYGAGSTFPNQTYENSNYWVDVVFTPTQASANAAPTSTPTPIPVPPTNTPTPTPTAVPPTSTPTPTPTSASINVPPLFSDGFESGNFSAWSGTALNRSGSATVSTIGAFAGLADGLFSRASTLETGDSAVALKRFTAPIGNVVWARAWVRFDSVPSAWYPNIDSVMQLDDGVELNHPKARFGAHLGGVLSYSYLKKDGTWFTADWGSLTLGNYYGLKIKFDASGPSPTLTWFVNTGSGWVQVATFTDTSIGTVVTPNEVRVGTGLDTGIAFSDSSYAGNAQTRVDQVAVSSADPG